MHRYVRFALGCVPDPTSDLAVLGKHWFGWDIETGSEATLLTIDSLPRSPLALIARRRRFGFHAPVLSPFRPVRGRSPLDLHHAARALASHFRPIELSALRMARRAHGVCLVPFDRSAEVQRLATTVERVFQDLRAEVGATSGDIAPPPEGIAKAPFELQYQMTDMVPAAETATVFRVLRPIIEPNLPRPFVVRSLSLLGEDTDGWFHQIQRYPFGGHSPKRDKESDLAPRLKKALQDF